MSANGISLSAFALRLGVTEGAVRKAIKSGRIPTEALGSVTVGSRTMPTIENFALAASCYTKGTQHAKGHQAGRSGDPALPELRKARFAAAMFAAKREQTRYEKEAGLLVPRHKVVLAIHEANRSLQKLLPRRFRAALDKVFRDLSGAIDRHDDDKAR